ncbi:uronyl 2-sulfotransferase isoform X2 [Exaiptasia diaphana]|uniref:Uncharacterized protein n=1 Tax=Exaiptasia diaphana TaxID=2652724 RepID=A0A913Y529_EXADI|nr:uronyl 2-sulfotransferase isoform X1 [Exaiptasia diaphana]XP_020914249.1 uronyl 2-sulfotransferase isoform X2 [Exaiptasia diaphana]
MRLNAVLYVSYVNIQCVDLYGTEHFLFYLIMVTLSICSPKSILVTLLVLSMYALLVITFIYNLHVRGEKPLKTLLTSNEAKLKENFTANAFKGRIIYNRVGKCGSRFMLAVMSKAAEKNQFKIVSSSDNGVISSSQRKLTISQQMKLVAHISEIQPPFVFHGHFHFVDFSKYGSTTPIYINLIRDPIDRFVSAYYFTRFGDGRNRTWGFKGTKSDKFRTLDECVLSNYSECTNSNKLLYTIPYFCGQTRGCRGSSYTSLRRAINNVVNNYLAVGVLEDVNSFIKVLERLLPAFFKEAYMEAVKIGNSSQRMSTITKNKRSLSAKARSVLRRRLHLEYRFYNFVKEKFGKLKKHLRIT